MASGQTGKRRILLVDDDTSLLETLNDFLSYEGYEVVTATSGEQALQKLRITPPDIIILDLGLPDLNGIAVLKQLREWTQTPVIILTVQDEEADKIEALDSGADDFITKPFNTGELLARLRASLRRADRGRAEEPVFRAGNLAVDFSRRRVTRAGQPVKLTATEYALLRLFIQHAGKVLTHRHILREIWGPEHEQHTQYLRVYVTRLREKLEADPASPALLLTEPGVWYRFVED